MLTYGTSVGVDRGQGRAAVDRLGGIVKVDHAHRVGNRDPRHMERTEHGDGQKVVDRDKRRGTPLRSGGCQQIQRRPVPVVRGGAADAHPLSDDGQPELVLCREQRLQATTVDSGVEDAVDVPDAPMTKRDEVLEQAALAQPNDGVDPIHLGVPDVATDHGNSLSLRDQMARFLVPVGSAGRAEDQAVDAPLLEPAQAASFSRDIEGRGQDEHVVAAALGVGF